MVAVRRHVWRQAGTAAETAVERRYALNQAETAAERRHALNQVATLGGTEAATAVRRMLNQA
jgi:hypothetical protein